MSGNIEQALDLGQGVYTQAEIDAIPSSLSKVASNVLMEGNLALASSAVTKSNANITYTGNGSTQSITTGIASVDFTVASNGSGYYHDRAAGDCIVKNDAGTIIESGSAVVNVSKVHIKCRSVSPSNNDIYDGLRGVSKRIFTDSTSGEVTNSTTVNFTSNSVSLSGGDGNVNSSGRTYILHQTLYTHIKWGLTNQGKRYITAYNPVTREVMTMYQGSGIAGHQIPNALGIKLDYLDNKNLDTTDYWISQYNNDNGYLNATNAFAASGVMDLSSDDYIELTFAGGGSNGNNQSHISYGFANSETKIITQYQGTGASGNFVETKDVNGVAKKPRRIIYKSTSITADWRVLDSERGDERIALNLSAAAVSFAPLVINSNGFTMNATSLYENSAGEQYIAIVEFDTTNSTDDTYFDLPTDDTNLNVTAGKLPFTDGRDTTNGAYNVFTQSYTGSVDFSTCPDGIHYVALDSNNTPKFYEKVAIGSYEKEAADDNRLVFNTEDGKWYTTTGGELVTNGTFDTDTSGWTISDDNAGTVVWNNGGANINRVGTATEIMQQIITTVVGVKYNLHLELNGALPRVRVYSGISYGDGDLIYSNNDLYNQITSSFTATSTTSTITILNLTDNTTLSVDNISVYKAASTLDTALTTPISFIDDKPYQVASGTPVYRFQTRKDRIRRSS